jgi:hypothetical protein
MLAEQPRTGCPRGDVRHKFRLLYREDLRAVQLGPTGGPLRLQKDAALRPGLRSLGGGSGSSGLGFPLGHHPRDKSPEPTSDQDVWASELRGSQAGRPILLLADF